MTIDIEALITEARSRGWSEAGYASTSMIHSLANALESVATERDAAIKEMHARELHHFEEEQKSAELRAIIDEALAEEERCTETETRMWRILSRATTTKKGTD